MLSSNLGENCTSGIGRVDFSGVHKKIRETQATRPINSKEKESLEISSFYGGDLSLYTDFRHPLGWNRKDVRRFLDQEFRRQPEIASILRRDPAIFTSNHAAFFCN